MLNKGGPSHAVIHRAGLASLSIASSLAGLMAYGLPMAGSWPAWRVAFPHSPEGYHEVSYLEPLLFATFSAISVGSIRQAGSTDPGVFRREVLTAYGCALLSGAGSVLAQTRPTRLAAVTVAVITRVGLSPLFYHAVLACYKRVERQLRSE
jgi:hypothetical protein